MSFELNKEFYNIKLYNCNIFEHLDLIPNGTHAIVTDPPYNKMLSKFEANEKKDTTKDDEKWDYIDYKQWKQFTTVVYDNLIDGGHFIFFGDVIKIHEFINSTDTRFKIKTIGKWEKGATLFFAQNKCGAYIEKRLNKNIKYTSEQSVAHNGQWGFYEHGERRKLILETAKAKYWNQYGSNPVVTWESIAFMKKQLTTIADTLLSNRIGGYKIRDGIGIIPVFVAKPDTSSDHLTPKPLRLMIDLLEYVIPFDYPFDNNYCYNIVDPFMGSATTLVAGMQLAYHFKRKVNLVGFEIRESAFNIAVDKIKKADSGLEDPLFLFRQGEQQ